MTPQQQKREEVGVRELHDQLSRYLHVVADGAEIVVTMRGKPVAKLTPIAQPAPLDELRRLGLVADPSHPRRRMQGRERPEPREPVAGLVSEQRD